MPFVSLPRLTNRQHGTFFIVPADSPEHQRCFRPATLACPFSPCLPAFLSQHASAHAAAPNETDRAEKINAAHHGGKHWLQVARQGCRQTLSGREGVRGYHWMRRRVPGWTLVDIPSLCPGCWPAVHAAQSCAATTAQWPAHPASRVPKTPQPSL